MPADSKGIPFFDTSYVVRIYLRDRGFEKVRQHLDGCGSVAAACHGQAETIAALHRAFRERRLEKDACAALMNQFAQDSENGLFHWLPFTPVVQQRIGKVYREASPEMFLRAADALHLACAAENGFDEVYSNDRHFLAAAPIFGLRGVDLIG